MSVDWDVLQFVTGPFPLVGLVLLSLAAIVPLLGGQHGDRKARRMLVFGLLAVGMLAVVGSMVLEFVQRRGLEASSQPAMPSGSQVIATDSAAATSAPRTLSTATDHATAISADGNVRLDSVRVKAADPQRERSDLPKAPATRESRASGHGTAISAGGDVDVSR